MLSYQSALELSILDKETFRAYLWFSLHLTTSQAWEGGKRKKKKPIKMVHLKCFLSVRARADDT